MACAPPQRKTRVTPESRAAARIASGIRPSFPGGETITISPQPASFAGMAFIKTVEG